MSLHSRTMVDLQFVIDSIIYLHSMRYTQWYALCNTHIYVKNDIVLYNLMHTNEK